MRTPAPLVTMRPAPAARRIDAWNWWSASPGASCPSRAAAARAVEEGGRRPVSVRASSCTAPLWRPNSTPSSATIHAFPGASMKKRIPLLALLLSLSAASAAQVLTVKPGLWEHKVELKSESGQLEKALDLARGQMALLPPAQRQIDRKSTRLNSSHVKISYAVFCLKK